MSIKVLAIAMTAFIVPSLTSAASAQTPGCLTARANIGCEEPVANFLAKRKTRDTIDDKFIESDFVDEHKVIAAELPSKERKTKHIQSSQKMNSKAVYELTPSDLKLSSIWVLTDDVAALTGEEIQDETSLVQPPPADKHVLKKIFTTLTGYVRGKFTAADGKVYPGLLKFGSPNHLAYSIVLDDEQISFNYGIKKPTRAELDDCYQKLKTNAEKFFPLKYEIDVESCDLPLPTDLKSGTLKGFTYIELGKDRNATNHIIK
jgi:hypothetical protein